MHCFSYSHTTSTIGDSKLFVRNYYTLTLCSNITHVSILLSTKKCFIYTSMVQISLFNYRIKYIHIYIYIYSGGGNACIRLFELFGVGFLHHLLIKRKKRFFFFFSRFHVILSPYGKNMNLRMYRYPLNILAWPHPCLLSGYILLNLASLPTLTF